MSNSDQLTQALSDAHLDPDHYPNLITAYQRSEDSIEAARSYLKNQAAREYEDADVMAFGSLARREMTEASDFDFLVVTHGIGKQSSERELLELAHGLMGSLLGNIDGDKVVRPPGSTGMFGKIVAAQEFYQNIGLEADTNHSHSRRMLLLEESVSLARPDLHERLLEVTLDRYLADRVVGSDSVPRFLLNDIVRYWRTIAVDYQAKVPGKGRYSVRYLKLLISRKLVFVASIAPLFLCRNLDHDDVAGFLLQQYSKPAFIRFLGLAAELHENEPAMLSIKSCMDVAEELSGLLGDQHWRDEIGAAALRDEALDIKSFAEMRLKGKQMQKDLECLFSEEPLKAFKNKYLLF
ncbi:nucleotidyltransferase domain-containing protein [Streptomyces griseorubiginosus]|uniref:nucleotidyltransferase domain-containing protein n=1 Tax=Streptomyces griseorubiginosus TaxID=67304 RepID=UPI003631D163